jgi:hypothetical protein
MQKFWVFTITSGIKGGKIVEAANSIEARKLDGDPQSTMARALETSEGELGYWSQTSDGPVWNKVGEA